MSCLCPPSEVWLCSPYVVAYCPPLVLVLSIPFVVDFQIGLPAIVDDINTFHIVNGRGGSEFFMLF